MHEINGNRKSFSKYYEEIEYSKDFGSESFISNLGGFIGIFLGYSMMQLPELLGIFHEY